MQLSTIEKQVVAVMHDLPPDKQQSILDFTRFLKAMALDGSQSQASKRQAGFGKKKSFVSEAQ